MVDRNHHTHADHRPTISEGWQSGRMRRSRKPLSVVRRIEGSNPSPSAFPPNHAAERLLALRKRYEQLGRFLGGDDSLAPTASRRKPKTLSTPCDKTLGRGKRWRERRFASPISRAGSCDSRPPRGRRGRYRAGSAVCRGFGFFKLPINSSAVDAPGRPSRSLSSFRSIMRARGSRARGVLAPSRTRARHGRRPLGGTGVGPARRAGTASREC